MSGVRDGVGVPAPESVAVLIAGATWIDHEYVIGSRSGSKLIEPFSWIATFLTTTASLPALAVGGRFSEEMFAWSAELDAPSSSVTISSAR